MIEQFIAAAPWLAPVFALAALGFYLRGEKRARALEALRHEVVEAKARAREATTAQQALDEERDLRRDLEARAAAQDAVIAERERALEDMRARHDAAFKATTAEMLESAHQQFLKRANETFEHFRAHAGAEHDKRKKSIDDLLRPVSETLTRYEKGLTEMRAEQSKSRGELSGQLSALVKTNEAVRAEAQKLAAALRAGPKTRGRWGEEQLRNVVEMAGMRAHVDFVEQASHSDGESRKQPDMVVHLPGGRVIAVDSKVSLEAYLDAADAETDDARALAMTRHADDLWAHVKALSKKDYAASLKDALDYVVMFVPGENYYAAALEARPALYQDAFDRKILIATPTLLVALLKTAALNWRQENAAKNAEKVAGLARDLYESLSTMGQRLAALGGSIKTTVDRYNSLIGNVESRVMPRARKFADYELPGIEAEIEEAPLLESNPRALAAGRDLLTGNQDDEKNDAA